MGDQLRLEKKTSEYECDSLIPILVTRRFIV